MEKLSRTLLLTLIWLYQILLSPFIGRDCRYYPTCSHYAQDALRKHGAWRGSFLAIKRLMRCHPWGGCGIDHVPDTYPTKTQQKRKV